jgi:sulfur relay (sulfurtransferase) DsrC/TusE family protein
MLLYHSMRNIQYMQRIWLKKFNSFKDADEADLQEHFKMTPNERIELMQYLREIYYKFNKRAYNESRKGLRRTFKIIQQAQS